jgi:hypothetical protein
MSETAFKPYKNVSRETFLSDCGSKPYKVAYMSWLAPCGIASKIGTLGATRYESEVRGERQNQVFRFEDRRQVRYQGHRRSRDRHVACASVTWPAADWEDATRGD